MQNVQIIEIPACKMVSSGVGMFDEGVLEAFDQWFSTLPRGIFPKDFLFWDISCPEKPGFRWLYLYEEGLDVPEEFEIIDFSGGLYAVATDIDEQTDMDEMNAGVNAFLAAHGMERDPSRPDMGNVITSPLGKKLLGYNQTYYWTPVKQK